MARRALEKEFGPHKQQIKVRQKDGSYAPAGQLGAGGLRILSREAFAALRNRENLPAGGIGWHIRGKSYVLRPLDFPTLRLHELVHGLGSFGRGYSFLTEGATEHLAQAASRHLRGRFALKTQAYPLEAAFVRHMVKALGPGGEGTLRRAYFSRDVGHLRLAVDRARGQGSFDRAATAFKDQRYGEAYHALGARP